MQVHSAVRQLRRLSASIPNVGLLQSKRSFRVTVETIDPALVKMKYAVRGEVVEKAAEMSKRLEAGEDLPFKMMVPCNIGNPQAVKQPPISFYRQVGACVTYPELMETDVMPADVIARAKEYLAGTGGNGIGAYTESAGMLMVRKQIAEFIERRDGFPCDPDRIQLTTGASQAVNRIMSAMFTATDKEGAVMIPCPQYPLYSAGATKYGAEAVYYSLDEEANWSLSKTELVRSYDKAAADGFTVRAIAVINPGNPTGAVLSYEDMQMIIDFAKERGLLILADEVYQENIYDDTKQFHSFKKVLSQTIQKHPEGGYGDVQVVSFHSNSKGLIGECGIRGGYAEFFNFSDDTMAVFLKMASVSLCSSAISQIFCGLMTTPPKEGDPSYPLFKLERDAIYDGLKRRAKLLQAGLNEIEGISCANIEGAMYAFPSLHIPPKAVARANELGIAADQYWCLRLVEETGIICVPGSGFGQKEGTFHFRTTILPPDDMMQGMLEGMKGFQKSFLKEFA
mmetsp:Transcript_128951/g.223719  ORF Transcript_128951/g.223719 Transcript_128951/m.223719 type:complete len:510 (+) Transcript_128951:53-1582(+)